MNSFLWISVVTAIFVVLMMIQLSSESVSSRRVVLAGLFLLLAGYLGWRISVTVAWGGSDFSGIYTQLIFFIELCWIVDVIHSLHFYVYPQKILCTEVSVRTRQSSIDVVVPSYNEPKEILDRTLMAAKNLVWPGEVRIYLLDDGKRDWLPSLCKKWGATYISRPDNASAKAGNINHALTYLHGDFTLILDADFLVAPYAIEKLIAPMEDSKVAVVQAPQEFYNPDPIQRSLEIYELSPNDQRHFFNGVLHARSNGEAAFFCGSCGLIRNSALKQLGGFPTESITEDIFLSIKLKQIGYESVAIQDPVAVGLSPETINDMIKQRSRWGEGAVQMTSKLWELNSANKSLKLIDRVKFLPMYWTVSFPVRFISLLVPQLYFLFGWSALAESSTQDLLMAQGSVVVGLVGFNFWISKKRLQPFVTSIWQDLLSLRLTPKFLMKLFRPYQAAEFDVTPKGQKIAANGHPRSFDIFVNFLVIFTGCSFVIALFEVNDSGISVVSFFWTVVNLIRLVFVRTALRSEKELQPFEIQVKGRSFRKLWIERGNNMHPVADCLISESQISTKNKQPVGDALVQLTTEEGLANVGYTDELGKIVFFTEQGKALWLSGLVEAELTEVKAKEQMAYNSIKAFVKVLTLALRIKHV
jgi:cellulose synthase (UDP-forming)